jgi:hypothetical protein
MSNLLNRIKKLEEKLKVIDPRVVFIRRYPSGEIIRVIISRRFATSYARGKDESEEVFLESIEHIEKMTIKAEPFDKEKVFAAAKQQYNKG